MSVKVNRGEVQGPLLLEAAHKFSEQHDNRLHLGESLVYVDDDGCAEISMINTSGLTCKLNKGQLLGLTFEAVPITDNNVATVATDSLAHTESDQGQDHDEKHQLSAAVQVITTTDQDDARKRNLIASVAEVGTTLPWQDRGKLQALLCEFHCVFALEEGESGETEMMQMEIDTGDSDPMRQPGRRVPFTAREEIARQLRSMQNQGVIYSSSSPWESPIVLVHKNDGSLRFYIDYRNLNSVTKSDTFPLPRVDDMLDQLGKSKFFSTLDLAAGYW